MIRIGEHSILLLLPDGRSVPFDQSELRDRVEKAVSDCIETKDTTIAQDIALAAEMAVWDKIRTEENPAVPAQTLDALVVRILQSVGMTGAAEAFRRNSLLHGDFQLIPMNKISFFLEENLNLHGDTLERITEKVFNTMRSIGADETAPALVLELAKHFLAMSAGKIAFPIRTPDFTPDKEHTIAADALVADLSPDARDFFSARILKVHPVNLRIFPALRLDLRLTGIAERENLLSPFTELALGAAFIRCARAADELSLIADRAFREHGHEADTPVKLLLHVTDASIFTRDRMGCSTQESQEKCAVSLCRVLAQEMTRFPFQMTCT